MMTAWSFLVGVLPLVFSSGAGCESRQAIGLVTFAGMLVATVVGIAFPPAYFAMFSRRGGMKRFTVRRDASTKNRPRS